MSDKPNDNITMDDLDHFWAGDGLPVFFANREDICDIVEGFGFQIYYLLGNTVEEVKKTTYNNNNKNNNSKSPAPAGTTTYTKPVVEIVKHTTWLKVVNNFVGRAVTECDPPLEDSYVDFKPSAFYNMPPIPWVMVEKLDQFFRLVDAQHGTESIVMLTYDLDKEGPEGWGILVPDQENTAAHCNYDPHSIAEIKPDNVMIVGSVHSHPKMAAYASGTDHADQADFDGIHITFGWQKSVNNGATQYHIEMQMAGTAYTLQPEDVFENYTTEKEPDPEVVEWSSKVKKELPPLLGVSTPASTRTSNRTSRHTHHTTQTGTRSLKGLDLKWIEYAKTLPFTQSIPSNAILALEVDVYDNKEQICPVCSSVIDEYCLYDGCCDVCLIPTVSKGTSIDEALNDIAYYAYQTDLNINAPVYLIAKDAGNDPFIMSLTSSTLAESISSKTYVSNNDSDYSPISEDVVDDLDEYLLCCGLPKDSSHDCKCKAKIDSETLLDFDVEFRELNIYQLDAACNSCANYYLPSCPAYMTLIEQYAENPSLFSKTVKDGNFEEIDDYNCDKFEVYNSRLESTSIYYD